MDTKELICELFLEIIRSYLDKKNFFYYCANNLKMSTIVSVNFFTENSSYSFFVKIGFEVENLC